MYNIGIGYIKRLELHLQIWFLIRNYTDYFLDGHDTIQTLINPNSLQCWYLSTNNLFSIDLLKAFGYILASNKICCYIFILKRSKITMIRKVAMFLTLIFVIIFCYNCSSEIDPDKLTFDPINVDENTIFMFDGKDDKVHKIYAIDTKNSKKIYTYEFKKMLIFSFVYDASLDQNPYILLPSGKVLKLDIKAGKIKKIDLDDAQESICITDNKLWMCQSSKDGVGNLYNIYDPKTETIEKKTLSEKGSYYGDSGVINGNRYLPLYYGSASAKIYNLSQERIVNNNLFTKEYTSFNFYLNNYLSSYIAGLNTLDIYFVDSIEPTFIKRFLFSMDIAQIS